MMIDNAQKYMQSVENECIRLISHGLFHCLGYKDKSSKEKEIMRKKKKSLYLLFHVKLIKMFDSQFDVIVVWSCRS